jgi:pimeloyl-ACP methyl ester carboxylesterase
MHAQRTDRRILVTVAGLGIAERRVRARDVWAARLCAWWLDRRLSAGEPAESSALLAVRAEWLVRPASRRELAETLLRVLALATEPSRAPLTVRIASGRVRAAAWELRDLVDRLLAEGPVSAYGVARLRALLADGGGPLHHGGSTEDLVTRLREVRCALDRLGTESRTR